MFVMYGENKNLKRNSSIKKSHPTVFQQYFSNIYSLFLTRFKTICNLPFYKILVLFLDLSYNFNSKM